MAEFFPVIEFFGVGAFVAWLAFLFSERADKIKDADRRKAAQKNIDVITQFYETSWILFAMAVLAEFAMTEQLLSAVIGMTMLAVVNALGIIFGLAMFIVPSYFLLRKTKRHLDYDVMTIPDVGTVLFTAIIALTHGGGSCGQ